MEKFKKQIAVILTIILLFLLGLVSYQFNFSTFSSLNHQAASRIQHADQNAAVPIQNASLTVPARPFKKIGNKQRILSEREKYEKILQEHPFNNRERKIDSFEKEDDDRAAREEREEERRRLLKKQKMLNEII